MATSIMRGSGGSSVKEKRGTCPTSTIKKTPKPLSSPSSLVDKKTNSPRHSNKPDLRHTRTSTLVPKKSNADASLSKPTSTNKKSYDRPPPIQRVVRASPTSARDVKPQRSSSFSPASQRLYARASSLKAGNVTPNSPKSRSLKKSGCALSTKEKNAPKSVTCENQPSIDQLTLEDDFDNFDAHEVQSLPEMSEMPDSNEELGDPTDFKWEEGPNEITFEKFHDVDNERLILVTEQVEEGHQEDEQDKEHIRIEEVEPTEAKEERQAKTSQLQGCTAAGIGKKDKQDYNEVIEETASKLMGGKKNKVLALAGAFETVISLQDRRH